MFLKKPQAPSMTRKTLSFNSRDEWLELRLRDITSTECAALFGQSPYITRYQLFVQKRDQIDHPIKQTERMKWGTRLEATIAKGIGEDMGWEVMPFKDYVRIEEYRLGSSFDWINGFGELIEIKNVGSEIFKKHWTEDSAPPHIEMQVQHQLLVSGLKRAYIGAFVGGNKTVLIKREANPKTQAMILEKSEKFWEAVEKNTAPPIDIERDAEVIIDLNRYAEVEKEKVIEANEGLTKLCEEYKEASQKKAEAEKIMLQKKAEIFEMMGDAAKAKSDKVSVSAGITYTQERIQTIKANQYRNLRVTLK